jgi:hypothetical protein
MSTILLHRFLMQQTSAVQPLWNRTRSGNVDAKT